MNDTGRLAMAFGYQPCGSALLFVVTLRSSGGAILAVLPKTWREADLFLLTVQFISLLSEIGTHRVTDVVSQNVDRFAPLLVGDHVVAV